ncbi:MAG: hypothetical protein R3F54_25605 [Alphaproteobacteria bacterium]
MTRRPLPHAGLALALPVVSSLFLLSHGEAVAAGACSSTAKTMSSACASDVQDNFLVTTAACINIGDDGERKECLKEAKAERDEGRKLCKEQLRARRDVCGELGEGRYDPDFEPENFVNPLEIGGSVAPNPYFPLEQGRSWVYESEDETVTVTVTDRTKLIEGVRCLVVTDVVQGDGKSVEVTEDWFAQDTAGNVYYCGELVQNFEEQEDGEAELVDLDGSFKVGRDFAKPGLIMPAVPEVGFAYRQEFALGEAEDVARIVAIDASETTPGGSCSGDCIKTEEFTPIEPDVLENKFYAPGIGFMLEVDPESGDRLELIETKIGG